MTLPTPPGLEGLVDLACRDGVDIRPTLLRVLTDLYIQKPSHTEAEEHHYVELAQRLFQSVDAPTRAAAAARLMAYGQVPEALRPYLELRAILPEAQAEETRAPASIRVAKVALAAEPTLYTDQTAAAPTGDAVPEPTPAPAEAAAPRPIPARLPLSPAEQAAELTEIFLTAGPDERRMILAHLDSVAPEATLPPVTSRTLDTIRHLESAAMRHDAGAFARELVGALDIGRNLATRIVEDATGEPLLIVGRALGMPAAVLQRVLLFLNPAVGRSVQRVYELAALYQDISAATAAHLLSILRLAATPERPAYRDVLYQSAFWNDEIAGARDAATPHEHQKPAGNPGFADLPPPFRIGQR